MQYQVVKSLRRGSKTVATYGTLLEAHRYLVGDKVDATYIGVSYMGGFPIYKNERMQQFSIQGLAPIGGGVVCSLPAAERDEFYHGQVPII